ncbi:hypothetical protein D3C86_1307930 [compost metagenome]
MDRFDRRPNGDGKFLRLPMMSGLTLLDSDWKNPAAHEREWRYGLLVDEMNRRQVPIEDQHELYRGSASTFWSATMTTTPRMSA